MLAGGVRLGECVLCTIRYDGATRGETGREESGADGTRRLLDEDSAIHSSSRLRSLSLSLSLSVYVCVCVGESLRTLRLDWLRMGVAFGDGGVRSSCS